MMTTRCVPLLSRLSTLIIALVMAPLVFARGEKIKPEELVAKHLASIGTAEARVAARNRTVLGNVDVVFLLGGAGQLSGRVNFRTAGQMIRMETIFDNMQYPGDTFTFNGKKVNIASVPPYGVRWPLADFVYAFDKVLKEGLLGGTLSTAWPLLDLAHRQPLLQYTGLKDVEGKKRHELTYGIKKGNGDLLISLYFDPETFRLVRSQYKVGTRLWHNGDPTDVRNWLAVGGGPDVRSLVETFDDFKEVDGLTLPHVYKITYQQMGFLGEWNFAITQVLHNQPLDPKVFAIQQGHPF